MYSKGLTELFSQTATRDRLINTELDVIGPKMTTLIEQAKSSVISDQENSGLPCKPATTEPS